MNNDSNEKNGAEDVYPDISRIFNVDERRAAGQPVEKSADAPRKSERILTADEGMKHLPRADRKKMKKDSRKEKRAAAFKKAKTRAIVVLSALLVALIAAGVIWLRIAEKKKPAVAVAKATVETVERAYSDEAVIVSDDKGTFAVLIDNDYDVHYIEKKLRAEVVNAAGATVTGKVDEIREEKPGTDMFTWLATALLGDVPEVPFYAVYLSLDESEQILTGGERVNARIVTETAENAVAVPASAVLLDGAQPYVWIYHSFTKKLTRQDVAVGISSGEMTEVLRGLKKGVWVVSGASVTSAELYEGVRVKLN